MSKRKRSSSTLENQQNNNNNNNNNNEEQTTDSSKAFIPGSSEIKETTKQEGSRSSTKVQREQNGTTQSDCRKR